MTRREALSTVSLMFGGTIVGAGNFLAGCTGRSKAPMELGLLNEAEVKLLDLIGETIIPATDDAPGAATTKIGLFMDTIVTDCYEPDEQHTFKAGIQHFPSLCQKTYAKSFADLSNNDKYALLMSLEKEAAEYDKNLNKDEIPHYYTMIKQLTVWGYFTSRQGARQALRHLPVPGRYEACTSLKKGDKAWAI